MSAPEHDRLHELLADRALQGLSAEEAAELASLAPEGGDADDASFDLAAAALDVACAGEREPLPAHLAATIEAASRGVVPAGYPPSSFVRVRRLERAMARRDPMRLAGWMVAAACLALAAIAWWGRPGSPVAIAPAPGAPSAEPRSLPVPPPAAPTPAELRARVLAAADVVRVDWSATKDPAAHGASGDVVWSTSEQRGYMRFHGLAANDAAKSQYQLWIFDPSQDEKTPIDGGVFDVDPSTGDVLVAITPKLRVTSPTLFAVTVEKSGGVVVSKRERIVLAAPVKG